MMMFNGTRHIPTTMWSSQDAELATDACLSGIGGTTHSQFFHLQVPDHLRNQSINLLKAFAVMVTLKLWAPQFTGCCISMRCDNVVTVQTINNLQICSLSLQRIVWEIVYICATNQFEA
jgi:hypothetical protein